MKAKKITGNTPLYTAIQCFQNLPFNNSYNTNIALEINFLLLEESNVNYLIKVLKQV